MSDRAGETTGASSWPAIPVAEWQDTRDTLQLWTQIVGKVRMVNTPLVNQWWNVPLYVTERGLTTSLVPKGERAFEVSLDFLDHRLDVRVTDGSHAVGKHRTRVPAAGPIQLPGVQIAFVDRLTVDRLWIS